MVGLVVTPTTELLLMSSARFPVSMRSRDRSSSQMDTPASARDLSRSDIGSLRGCRLHLVGSVAAPCGRRCSALRVGDAALCGQRDRLCGDSELAVDRLVVRRGAVVLE